jgi:hypothetical protein
MKLPISTSTVIYTMRELRRQQVRTSTMNRDALDYIRDNRLMREHMWPASHIVYTEAGIDYLQEYDSD